jgi:alpha-tubulin suppressor-like RCC1 family protein
MKSRPAPFALRVRGSLPVLIAATAIVPLFAFSAQAATTRLMGTGSTYDGQLGIGVIGDFSTPEHVADNVASIAAGNGFTYFITDSNDLYSTGSNTLGQLGDRTNDDRDFAEKIAYSVASTSAGTFHGLFVTTWGDLYGMGDNYYGELGIDLGTNGGSPILSAPDFRIISHDVSQAVAADGFSLYITTTGDLYGMGYNGDGQLGVDLGTDDGGSPVFCAFSPLKIASNVAAAAASGSQSIYLTTEGDVYVMGDNSFGQLGLGTTTSSKVPVKAASGAKAVAAGHGSLYYLSASGDLYGAGDNLYGQLGVTLAGGATSSTSFVRIASNVTRMKAGESHLLYLTTAGDLYATGLNSSGQLGIGSQVNRPTPVLVARNVADMAAGAFHSLYLTNEGILYAFGENETGALGIESDLYKRRTPVDLAAFTVTFPHCAYKTNLYIREGTLYGFGDNNYGQLGDGSTSDRATPITIATNVANAASGLWHTLYVTSSGDLYAMGDNSRGQLGDGSTTQHKSPVKVASGVSKAATGGRSSYYVTTSGDLYAMGDNSFGQLGAAVSTNSGLFTVTPVKVASGVSTVAAGRNFAAYLTTSGDLYTMGDNQYGQLGVDLGKDSDEKPITKTTTPVKAASSVSALSAGWYHLLYLTSTGDLYSVGSNQFGQLGVILQDNSETGDMGEAYPWYTLTPQKVAGSVSKISAGATHSCYLTTTGELYGMGQGRDGRLGVSGEASRTTPVLIAESVSDVGAGYNTTLFLSTATDVSAFWPRSKKGAKYDITFGWIDDTYFPWFWNYRNQNWFYLYGGTSVIPDLYSYWVAYYLPNFSSYGWGYVYPNSGWWCFDKDMKARFLWRTDKIVTSTTSSE